VLGESSLDRERSSSCALASTSRDRRSRRQLLLVLLPPLDRLYQSHGPAVLRRARQLLGSDAEAREVLQDVFASLLEKPEQFAGKSSIMTFLYSMTTHLALSRLRRERGRQRLLERHQGTEPELVGPRGQVRAELRELLRTLSPELVDVAVYHYLDEMTQDEIAELLGCSRQWVTKLVARVRECVESSR
jgi:RNA polymerase sigma factor (sigma-70 family)